MQRLPHGRTPHRLLHKWLKCFNDVRMYRRLHRKLLLKVSPYFTQRHATEVGAETVRHLSRWRSHVPRGIVGRLSAADAAVEALHSIHAAVLRGVLEPQCLQCTSRMAAMRLAMVNKTSSKRQ